MTVELDLGFHTYRRETLRLAGINTPELHAADQAERDKAQKAKLELALLVMNRPELLVKTHKDKKEKYGRYLADVYIPNDDGTQRHVNSELVERGLARAV